MTGNPGSHINPAYKKVYFHMDPGCLPSEANSPDPGWLLCKADSFKFQCWLGFSFNNLKKP